MTFDMRDLANSLVANGQFHLPPNDVMRMGQVIGYDPNYNTTVAGGHDYPMVTITLAGDSSPLHGVRFADTYTPNLGDTVWVVVSGSDAFVLSKLTDIPNGNGTVRTPSTPGIIGHGDFTDTTAITSITPTNLAGTAITTSLLPNRLYKVEASFSFNITNADPTHYLSSGIMTPSGYYEMNTRTVTNGVYTASGHTIWANSSTSGNYPYNWTGTYPNAQFTWHFAAKTSASAVPTATGVFQRIVIHDLGVAH